MNARKTERVALPEYEVTSEKLLSRFWTPIIGFTETVAENQNCDFSSSRGIELDDFRTCRGTSEDRLQMYSARKKVGDRFLRTIVAKNREHDFWKARKCRHHDVCRYFTQRDSRLSSTKIIGRNPAPTRALGNRILARPIFITKAAHALTSTHATARSISTPRRTMTNETNQNASFSSVGIFNSSPTRSLRFGMSLQAQLEVGKKDYQRLQAGAHDSPSFPVSVDHSLNSARQSTAVR